MNTVSTKNIVKSEVTIVADSFLFERNGNTAVLAFSPESAADTKRSIDLLFWETDLRAMARGTMSAVMHLLQGNEFIGAGFLLKDKEMIPAIPLQGNLGYVSGSRLADLFPGFSLRGGNLNANGVYRITWDGFNVIAREVIYEAYVQGEGETQKHDRSALRLYKGSQILVVANAQGYRVKVAWASNPREHEKDYSPLIDYVEKLARLYVAGKFDEMAELRSTGMAKSRLWGETGKVYRKMARGEKADAKEMKLHTGGEVRINQKQLVGKSADVYRGNTILRTVTFTKENYRQVAGGIAAGGFTVIMK